MRIKILGLLLIAIFTTKIYSNIGGAIEKPAIVGRLVSFDSPKIIIGNEILKIKAHEKIDERYSADFSAEYLIISTSQDSQTISGVFYGMRTNDIEIKINNISVKKDYDSLTLSSFDSLFKEKVAFKRFYPKDWFDWKGITKTGYSFSIGPGDSVELKITGTLTAGYTSFWGLAEIGSMVWYKHPFLNRKTKPKEIQFEYLLEPISAWDSVGAIQIYFTYPKKWDLRSNIADISKGFYIQKIKQTTVEDSGYVTFQKTLRDSFPARLEFAHTEKHDNIFPGGPELRFGGSKQDGFVFHYRWEASFDVKPWIAIMPGIGIESNFNKTYRIVPMIKVNNLRLLFLGFSTGYVYDIKRNISACRAGISFDFMIAGIAWDWDYYPADDNWKSTIFGTISF
jgi:hypothetical protein